MIVAAAPTDAGVLLAVAVVLIAGFAGGGLARRIGLPSVTGQILIGIALGPSLLHVVTEQTVDSLQPLMHFALGLVAVTVGSHLELKTLRNARRRLAILAFCEATITPVLVFVGLRLYGTHWTVAALFAALSVSTAPATMIALVKETRARGVFVKTLIAAVALDNIACILIFEMAHASSKVALSDSGGNVVFEAILAPLRQLGLSAVFGLLIAWALTRVTKNVSRSDRLATASLVAILLTVGLADQLMISPLLACMFLGIGLANITPDKDEIGHRVFADFESAVFAIFFTLAGMQLHLHSLVTGGVIAVVLFALRGAGKYLAARVSMRLAGATEKVERWLGLALVPQAGVAVGLLLLIGDDPEFAEIYELLLAVGLAVVTLNEIIGPVLARLALSKSGEVGQDRPRLIDFLHEQNIVTGFVAADKQEAISKLVDVLISTNHLKVDRERLLESVLEREQDMSTCIGEGLSIPHGVLEEGEEIVGAMGVSSEGLNMPDTPDGKPVHCMVLLATPASQRDRHLEVLAALARAVGTDPLVRHQLFHASSSAHVYEILHHEEAESFNYFLK